MHLPPTGRVVLLASESYSCTSVPSVLPAGSIATTRYAASRKDGTNCSLALFGNFTYAELRPWESPISVTRLFRRPRDLEVHNHKTFDVPPPLGPVSHRHPARRAWPGRAPPTPESRGSRARSGAAPVPGSRVG